jgi:hypothetical protein
MVRSLTRQEYSLTTLLAREQAVIAVKAEMVQIKKIDSEKIFKNRKTHGGVDSNTLTVAVAHYIAEIFSHLLRKSGDKHVAFRVAIPFLLHAQVTLQVLHTVPFYRPLFLD